MNSLSTIKIDELKRITPEKYIAILENGEQLETFLTVVADYSLYSGRELTENEYAAVERASTLAGAKARALRIIGSRPMSRRELIDKLVEKGVEWENASVCADWLSSLHLLDDEEYAGMLVRHYVAKGYGKARIRNEFFRRGIPKEFWDHALTQVPEQGDTIDHILFLKLKGGCPDRKELKRAVDSLYRRGFSWEEISAAVLRYNSAQE